MDIVTPRSKAELEDALDEVVMEAYKHGVEVADGAYSLIHHDSSMPNWDVTIIRMV